MGKNCIRCRSKGVLLCTTSEGGKMLDIVSDAEAREYFYLLLYIWRRKDGEKIVSDAEVREYFYLRHLNEDWGRMWDIVSDAVERKYFYVRHLKEEDIVSDAVEKEYFYVIWRRKDICEHTIIYISLTQTEQRTAIERDGGHCTYIKSWICHNYLTALPPDCSTLLKIKISLPQHDVHLLIASDTLSLAVAR